MGHEREPGPAPPLSTDFTIVLYNSMITNACLKYLASIIKLGFHNIMGV